MGKQTDQQISQERKKRLLWSAGGLLCVIFFIFFTKYGVYEGWRLEREKAKIDSDIRKQQFIRDSLLQVMKRLEHDDASIERLARERYGMIKPGEEVLFVPPTQ